MSERINVLHEQWLPDVAVQVTPDKGGLIVENFASEKRSVGLRFPLRARLPLNGGSFTIRVAGEVLLGSGFGLVAKVGAETHYPMPLNSWNRFTAPSSTRVWLTIELGARCKVRLSEFWLDTTQRETHLFDEHMEFDSTLIVTPTYPSSYHLYLSGFVHSRVLGYRREGVEPVLLCIYNSYRYQTAYDFDGVRVLRGNLTDLITVLNKHHFSRIGIHFFDEQYALALDRASGNRDAEVLLWCHGPETLFYDLPAVNGPYFSTPKPAEGAQLARYRTFHKVMASFEQRLNVRWVFVSDWMRQRSRELLGLAFERSEVIPNTIDTQKFAPAQKPAEAKRKVLMIRRYDDERKYAVDLAVQAIVELSRRPIFSQLQFTIVGDGPAHDTLFEPLKQFSNVTFLRRFATHDEIASLHRTHGIALFPTRYDSQGVSACEAAASGLAVVSSDCSAISEFIPRALETLAPDNSSLGLADAVERLALDDEHASRVSKKLRAHIVKLCSPAATIGKELELLRRPVAPRRVEPRGSKKTRVTLTVGVPVYNMERLLPRCLSSLLAGTRLEGLEVLVVDDGSKDSSLEVARSFESRFPGIVRVIAKENGGHGSVINRVVAEAKGRYVRLVDSDDWVDPVNFARFFEKLQHEDVDVVLTDFAEDWAHLDALVEKPIYANIQPDTVHAFDLLANGRYGFQSWGPVLATATFRTDCLRRAQLRVDERIAYVDMEYCTLSLTHVERVKYFDLSVYRYFLGRPNQTVERASFERKYMQHEQVIFRIANYVENTPLSEPKQQYIVNNILKPLIHSHRMVVGEWLSDEEELKLFDRGVRRYSLLRDLHLPDIRVDRLGKLKHKVERVLLEGIKLALPYRFVNQLEPGTLGNGRRAAKYTLEYFTPALAVQLAKDVKAGRTYWYEEVLGPATRVVDARKRLVQGLVAEVALARR
ncbi:MAG: glycosyltransferase [Myxococcaceae bacterium]|jgi:glycosyltransferase involved in cell wall biosynthesis|nr:glycosyltransferase [Myxococcaceae bacterium]